MLVLSRRVGERIRMEIGPGEYVWIAILDVEYNKVRLGLLAPNDVPIVREELLEEPRDRRER